MEIGGDSNPILKGKMATLAYFRWYGGRIRKAKLRREFRHLPAWLACFIAKHSKCKRGIQWRDFAVVIKSGRIVFSTRIHFVAHPNLFDLIGDGGEA